MPVLLRSRSVLQRGRIHGDYVGLVPQEDGRSVYITVPREMFDDLGQPECVTVTIEPGDLLNDGCRSEHSPASEPGCTMRPEGR